MAKLFLIRWKNNLVEAIGPIRHWHKSKHIYERPSQLSDVSELHPAVLQTTAFPHCSLHPRQPNFIHQAKGTRMAKIAPTPIQCIPKLTPPPPPVAAKKHPHNSLTHSYILCFVYIAGLRRNNKNNRHIKERKALGNPLGWRHRVRAINRDIRELLYEREEGPFGKQDERFEWAIKEGTRNLAAHFERFAVSWSFRKNGRESGKQEVPKRAKERERERGSVCVWVYCVAIRCGSNVIGTASTSSLAGWRKRHYRRGLAFSGRSDKSCRFGETETSQRSSIAVGSLSCVLHFVG